MYEKELLKEKFKSPISSVILSVPLSANSKLFSRSLSLFFTIYRETDLLDIRNNRNAFPEFSLDA